MLKKTLVSIDTGMSNGVVVGAYSDDTPFELTHALQIEGGVEEFIKNVRFLRGDYGEYGTLAIGDLTTPTIFADVWDEESNDCEYGGEDCEDKGDHQCYEDRTVEKGTVLVEKFTSRGAAAGPFSLKTNALESLRIEGALLAMGVPVTWVSPAQQYFIGGRDKAEKKKRQHAWLKENGFYIAPKDLGTKDADDVRSALGHAISWLRRQRHAPTLSAFRKDL